MSNVLPLTPADQWQFSVDIMRTSSGPVAVLTDARRTIVEGAGDSAEKVAELADMLTAAAEHMRKSVVSLKAPPRGRTASGGEQE